MCGGLEAEVFGFVIGCGDDTAVDFLVGWDAGDSDIEKPDFFEPSGQGVFEIAGDGEEVSEGSGKFFFVDSHVGLDAEALARGLEPEDCLPHDGTESTPLLELEFGVDGFLVVAELFAGHFVGLDEGELDEGSEGGDDYGVNVGGGAGLGEKEDCAVPLLISWAGCAVSVEGWAVIEPFGIWGEFFAVTKVLDRAVEVLVTVEDEGFGELERDGGFATAGWADEEEGLWEAGEEVGGGFHWRSVLSWN